MSEAVRLEYTMALTVETKRYCRVCRFSGSVPRGSRGKPWRTVSVQCLILASRIVIASTSTFPFVEAAENILSHISPENLEKATMAVRYTIDDASGLGIGRA